MKYLKTAQVSLVSLCAIGLLTACGGGGGESTSTDDGNISLTGSVFAAPVRSARVTISDCNGNAVTAGVTTNVDGSYTFNIPPSSLNQDLCIESDGGTFDDEATGTQGRSAGRLSAFIPSGSFASSANVHLTPGSTIVYDLVTQHRKSYADANTLFTDAFGYTPDVTQTLTDATNPNSTDEASRLAGLRAALFSQLNMDMGLLASQQFSMLDALARDLSDDVLDGQDAGGQVIVSGTATDLPADILNRYSMAMYNFRIGGNDNTGLSNDKLGSIPFARLAMTTSYKVEYIADSMMETEGKTNFILNISDHDGNAVPDLNISLMPMMYMNGMEHSTPIADVINNADGTYDATIYYLMASSMMNGMSMGYWKLDIMIGDMGGETATFYPDIMMAMGDSVKATLKGSQLDMIGNAEMGGMDMDGMTMFPENRSYYLFKEDLMPMTAAEITTYTLKFFIAANENMMSYKPVFEGARLSVGTPDVLDISSATLEISADRGATWHAGVDNGNGLWTVMGLPLTADMQSELQVRLTINGEIKTTDGTADGDDAIMLLTPGSMPMTMP